MENGRVFNLSVKYEDRIMARRPVSKLKKTLASDSLLQVLDIKKGAA